MKTPMQEILEGCGKEISRSIEKITILCGNSTDYIRMTKDKIAVAYKFELCPLCKKAKEERIKCIKEELEFLEGIKNFIMTCEMEKEYTLTDINKFINRISFLKSELKKGEGK
jgi:hypothetical protein